MNNREIKGRSWDGSRMIYWDTLEIDFMGKTPIVRFKNDSLNGQVRLTEHKDMLFTGLKDKDGQEIYEGDIVSAEDRHYIVEYREQYCDYMFTYIRKNWKKTKVSKQNITRLDVEVIGNKFEHPELLEND